VARLDCLPVRASSRGIAWQRKVVFDGDDSNALRCVGMRNQGAKISFDLLKADQEAILSTMDP
jgi:hypothetical protein